MDKPQAQQLIRDLFTKPFDRENYQHFLLNLLNHFETRDGHYAGNLIPDAFKQHINQYWRIGKYVDPDGNELDLLVVEVKSLAKLERARSALRNFAVDRLKKFEKEASLIAFYAKDDGGEDWRFSFVNIEHEAYQDAKGKVKLKEELTPARRHSYLVGKHENSHTACTQLLPVLAMDYADPKIKEIEAAFSVEKVTGEFFDQYKALFQKLAEHLKKQRYFQKGNDEEGSQAVSRFAKKLLGQIVFLYFLQKKGWLGVPKNGRWGEGSRRFMRVRFDQVANSAGEYYRDFLQYLFYEALADERKDQDEPGFYERFNCRIPFLNGGLFEADYDWREETIDLPNALFHNVERTKAGDEGTGILDVFDRYNFTIKEDEPLDKEVAVDPEMLGKVFENMLEITERKSKGAFYTPREIVHYMCQESLIYYLDNCLNSNTAFFRNFDSNQLTIDGNLNRKGQLKLTEEFKSIQVPKDDLEILIRKGHIFVENDTGALLALERIEKGEQKATEKKIQLPESIRQHAKNIDHALSNIKVCDPAIGSGAFPVGMLHEIINARLAIAPHSGNAMSTYELKRHTIAESIYGVDTDASAIDIARLRLWLSLIVDEEDYDTIEALPNLDYKIVRGDSLIGYPENLKTPGLTRIEEFKKQFFQETDHQKKAELKDRIDHEIRERSVSSKKSLGWQVDFDFRLFFSEVWHEKDGFDLVIGNPPYIQIQNFSGQQIQKDWEKQGFETFAKTGDIYCLFYETGHRLLRKHGVLSFITSNKWMRAGYGEKLRRFFLNRAAIYQLIDFGDSPIFSEAITYTNILLFEKTAEKNNPMVWDLSSNYRRATSMVQLLNEIPAGAPLFSEDAFSIARPEMVAIKRQVEDIGTPLKEWDIIICRGFTTGLNEAFIINGKTKDKLIAQDLKNAEIIKPILRGRDIKRYRVDFADLWLIFVPWHFPLHNNVTIKGASSEAEKLFKKTYPAIYGHLLQFNEALSTRNKSETGIRYEWYALQRCAATYYEEFGKEKIVWLEMSPKPNFAYYQEEIFVLNTSYIMTGKYLKWLLAIINSELMDCYFPMIATDVRGKTRRYIKQYVELLPVVTYRKDYAVFIEPLVDYLQITKVMNQNLQSIYFEQVIDSLVYEIYFPEEIITAGKEIQPYLGDLTPLNKKMNKEEKLAIIQREFDRLYDPRHPVRNHLETLDSVEVVRTIREALKR